MSKASSISFLFLATPSLLIAQLTPAIGWDSLRTSIRYPEILRRSGIEGAVHALVFIDSTGAVDSISTQASHPWFAESTKMALRSTRWVPESITGMSGKGAVAINIHFFIKGDKGPKRLSIEVDPAVMSVDPMPLKEKLKPDQQRY